MVYWILQHEKICVIDETIAFMGGFDLCFGRWDTPDHSLVDDRPKGYDDIESVIDSKKTNVDDVEDYQYWPGKGMTLRDQDIYGVAHLIAL